MEKYEYKTISFQRKGLIKVKVTPDEELNKLGAEGWKVVTSFEPLQSGTSNELYFTLMRKVN
jgi:hypothetical protein